MEEQSVVGTTVPTNTLELLTNSKEDPIVDSDEIEVDDTIGSDPSNPDYTPADPIIPDPSEHDYTLADHEHIRSNYELDEDEEDITNSP